MKRVYLILAIFLFGACSPQKNKLIMVFDNVSGITDKSEIKMNGVVVGSVYKMSLLDMGVLVKASIEKEVRIPINSKASVVMPFLGNSFIDIVPSDNKNYLSPQDTLRGVYFEEKILDKLTSDTTKKRKIQDALEKLKEGIDSIIKSNKSN